MAPGRQRSHFTFKWLAVSTVKWSNLRRAGLGLEANPFPGASLSSMRVLDAPVGFLGWLQVAHGLSLIFARDHSKGVQERR